MARPTEGEIERLLASYPRTRPPLPEAHRRVYEQEYRQNREGGDVVTGLARRLEGWMHRQVAARPGGPVLELGAGTLNHLAHERDVSAYDAVEPFAAFYAGRPERARVRHLYESLAEVPAEARYARIVSVAVLEHLEDLPGELARASRLLAEGGVFQAGFPSEGGFLWWLGWRCTTGVAYWLRNRIDYGALMRHEHVNDAREILAVVRALFEEVTVRRFPLPAHHLSFYACLEARRPRRERAERILASRSGAA